MRRALSFVRGTSLSAAVLVITSACGGTTDVAPPAGVDRTELTIAVRMTAGAEPTRYELSCDPPHGTIPNPRRACDVLERVGAHAFAPVAADTACTQIYGGPAVAEVGGVVGTEPVDATFNRMNGCEIERWNRLRDVVPVPAGAP